MATKKTKKTEVDVVAMLKEMKKEMEGLTGEVRNLKRKEQDKIVEEPEKKDESISAPPVQTTGQHFPIPQEYREVVDQTLSRHFGISVEGFSDKPAFMFTISVPRKYSQMTEEDWNMKGADLRTRVVSYAEGVQGVKLWAEKVFNNFSPEMRAQIIMDRVK